VYSACLALGVLRGAAGFAQTDFLAFNLTGITRYKAGFTQSRPH